jgi:hypothetical protein
MWPRSPADGTAPLPRQPLGPGRRRGCDPCPHHFAKRTIGQERSFSFFSAVRVGAVTGERSKAMHKSHHAARVTTRSCQPPPLCGRPTGAETPPACRLCPVGWCSSTLPVWCSARGPSKPLVGRVAVMTLARRTQDGCPSRSAARKVSRTSGPGPASTGRPLRRQVCAQWRPATRGECAETCRNRRVSAHLTVRITPDCAEAGGQRRISTDHGQGRPLERQRGIPSALERPPGIPPPLKRQGGDTADAPGRSGA